MIGKRGFCDALIDIAPEIRPIVDGETEDEDGYIRLHNVMMDVMNLMLKRLERYGSNDEVLGRLLLCLESSFSDGDYDVEDAIGTSFVQSLGYRRESDNPYPDQLLELMGPSLTAEFEKQENSL